MGEPAAEHRVRVRVFVDFWNFQLSLNGLPGEHRFHTDWKVLGGFLAAAALRVVDDRAEIAYQGMNVYGSYGEGSADARLRRWAESTLATFPGVHVEMLPRRKVRSGPACPSCRNVISNCPFCEADMRGTEEKGVDTRITTAMISLAWIDNYDVAILVSSDRDFVPVVEFLETRGKKVVHGAFPPGAAELTRKCWGSIDIPAIREHFRRPSQTVPASRVADVPRSA